MSDMEELDCPTCGVVFSVNGSYKTRRIKDHKNFYCPNGHTLSYSKQTERSSSDLYEELKGVKKENTELGSKVAALTEEVNTLKKERESLAEEFAALEARVNPLTDDVYYENPCS